ncbi:MAG TPA: Maf family protein [Verrucomicrobiae bacterium]|jgi:septum formation protein|nr:Maf family protein [Verrucomicrobiae bacterium]
MRLVLASSSPRRREILALLRIPFEAIEPDFSEIVSEGRRIEREVLDFAAGKANSIAARHSGCIVIGSDTMIRLDQIKLGKPEDLADAKRMLGALAGKRHTIYTAVAIVDGEGGPGLRVVEEVSVKMRAYSKNEIDEYLAYGESLDKAGAYSIQGHGRALIESIVGDYLAAVGLPLMPIAHFLRRRGIALPVDVEKLYADKSYRNWSTF